MTNGEKNIKVPKVSNSCIGCGACVAVCDEVFDLDDDGKAFVKVGKDTSNSSCIDDAIGVCPVSAISYKD